MPKSQAFDLKQSQVKGQWADSDAAYQNIVTWLADELDLALSARGSALDEIRYCWDYYEQNRMRGRNSPWPDAADLPSPYAPEYVDAIHARLMQTIFVDPVWTVEGFGPSAAKARAVEQFHQKAQEEERLQGFIDEWVLNGLVEGIGTLEISESTEMRTEQRTRTIKALLDPLTAQPAVDAKGKPIPETGDDGGFVDAEEGDAAIEADVDQPEPVRTGPAYDVIPYGDFLTLPVHARNKSQVWGYAKRFYRRVPELQAKAKAGIYDAEAVEGAGTDDEASDQKTGVVTPPTQERTRAQKELWEIQLLVDFDGKGERWWRATIHKDRRQLLRLKHDDRTTRYLRWMPFPKSGSRGGAMDRGYSLIGHKLITVIEEDTARRNMTADRMAMAAGAPVLRHYQALWDPFEQPWGPRASIDVRDMNEIKMLQVPDVPQSLFIWGQQIRQDGDRLIGQNDTALGVDTEQDKTLGEVKLRSAYAEVRVNVIVKRMQEPMEELGQARHTIWLKALRENPQMSVTRAMVIGRDVPGIEMNTANGPTITPEMMDGTFWFMPRGSVETADLNMQKANFNGLLQVLPAMMQINPVFAALLRTMPAARALMEQMLRVYRWPDRQSFLGSEAHDVFAQFQEQQQLQSNPAFQMLMGLAGGMQGGQPGAMPGQPPQGQSQAGPPDMGTLQ